MGPDNQDEMPGVISSSGRYWRDQRRFLLKNLKDLGFGRSSMESLIQEEMIKLCSKLSTLPEVGYLILFICDSHLNKPIGVASSTKTTNLWDSLI